MRFMRLIVAMVTAVALCASGCSFVLVDGPPASLPPQVFPACDESNTWPVIDTIIAASYVLAAVVAGVNDDRGDFADSSDSRTGAIIGSSLFAAAFGASAWVGYGRTSECRARRAGFINAYGSPYGQPMYGPPQAYPPPPGYAPPPPGYAPPPTPAGEGQTCHPQLGCQTGLTCASNLCVQLAPPPQAPGAQPPQAPGAQP